MHPEVERKCTLFLQVFRRWPFHVSPSLPDPIPALKLGLKELTHWDGFALNFISPSSVISERFYTTFQVDEISLQKRFACVHCFQSLKKQIACTVRQVNVSFLKKAFRETPQFYFALCCRQRVSFPHLTFKK